MKLCQSSPLHKSFLIYMFNHTIYMYILRTNIKFRISKFEVFSYVYSRTQQQQNREKSNKPLVLVVRSLSPPSI